VEACQADLGNSSSNDASAELSSVVLAASIKGRLWQVATLGEQLRAAA
jgi:hypothetical protein